MERFAVPNPSRASLAGIDMPPRGHRVEVRLCYLPMKYIRSKSPYPTCILSGAYYKGGLTCWGMGTWSKN